MTELLSNVLAAEQQLITEAAEALPHQFNVCTYSLGYIRQAVYLCLTCSSTRGICSACSIACHTDHEQVELFPKRKFRCDCPTKGLEQTCTLHNTVENENTENSYGQNFHGKFCRCGRAYDANKEIEAMIQCVACEDWFHESCLNLRDRPPSRENSPSHTSCFDATPATQDSTTNPKMVEASADDVSVASLSDLPLPLISEDDYDSLVCRECMLKIPAVRRFAGTEGAMVVVRGNPEEPWRILGRPPDASNVASRSPLRKEEEEEQEAYSTAGSNKRGFEGEAPAFPEETRWKRPRTDNSTSASESISSLPTSTCTAPAESVEAREIFEKISTDGSFELGAGDVFFTEGWRERWCSCEKCRLSLVDRPYLLEEDETYEPPEDPDSGFSLEELGLRALQALPRDKAINGIRAFNEMRDELLLYLRPFADRGEVVGEADVRAFFREKEESMRVQRMGAGEA